jgi:hypothetical protein
MFRTMFSTPVSSTSAPRPFVHGWFAPASYARPTLAVLSKLDSRLSIPRRRALGQGLPLPPRPLISHLLRPHRLVLPILYLSDDKG